MATMELSVPVDPNLALEDPIPPPEPEPLLLVPPPPETAIDNTPHQPSLPAIVYGVRHGKGGVQGIFLQWEHCSPFVDSAQCDHPTEYQTFTNLEEAAHYVLNGNQNHTTTCSVSLHNNTNTGTSDEALPPQNTAAAAGPVDIATTNTIGPTPDSAPVPNPPPVKAKKKAPVAKKKTKAKHKKASKYWNAQFEEYKAYLEATKENPAAIAVPVDNLNAKKMDKFEREQRTEYRYKKLGKETKMIQDKISRLKAIGFDFQFQELLQEDTLKWDTMLTEFKAYQKACTTTSQPKQTPALRDWKHAQRVQFQHLQDGKRSALTPDRIQQLNDAGFTFKPRANVRTPTWEERLEQVQAFKDKHGHLNIPSSDPELGYWTSNIRRAYKYLREGKKTGFTEEKAMTLTGMGFNFVVGKRKTGPVIVKTWDEQFQNLLDFKRQFGHTVVPQHYPGLGRWVKQMRREFKLMKEGKRSTMTPEKTMKLADIGFVFDAQFRRGSKISTNDFTKVGGKKKGDQGG